ncbi:MAG: hypothetical protein HOP11_13695 [Saprospiraceae bacterium]|nr:hypothetical protein [Saprospiraceae bacterium]
MGFLSKIFGSAQEDSPSTLFGRNHEIIKSEEQLACWEKALVAFEAENYIDSIEHFCGYLKDPESELIKINRQKSQIEFSLIQGSRVIEFYADSQFFRARADIAKVKEDSIGLLRRLLESSYKLIYGRYSLQKDNTISIVFDGYVQEASPNKLFEGLKEISLRADKEDDLLLEDFDVLEKIETNHVIHIEEKEKEIKFKYYSTWISRALKYEDASGLDLNRYPGAQIYILLSVIYKIDYLLIPEGKIMDIIESGHKSYFDKNEYDLGNKAIQLENLLTTLSNISKEKFYNEMYLVKHIFPITRLISTHDLAKSIDVEMSAMDWYYTNRHYGICKAICDYIVGSNFFNHSIPYVSHQLMHVYFEIREPEFFKELGFENKYDLKDLKSLAQIVEEKVRKILKEEWEDISVFEPNLKFNAQSEVDLLISYIRFIQCIQD